MEKLFTKNLEEFNMSLVEIIGELKEANINEYGWSTLEGEEFDEALFVLESIYKYVKTLPEAFHSTEYMLRQIYNIMMTGEFMYLYEHKGYSDEDLKIHDSFVRLIKERRAFDDLYLAARWLEYYYRVYESRWSHPVDNKAVGERMVLFEEYLGAYLNDEFEELFHLMDAEEENKVPFPVRLYDYIEEYVIGQPELELLALAIDRFVNLGCRENITTLLKGPTGSGKNYVMKVMENCPFMPENVVFLNWDISKNTPEGFVGRGTKDIVEKMKAKCEAKGIEPKKAKVIAFLNEADKIFQPNTDSHNENQNAMVQQQILTMVEGEEVIDGIDMKNWMFIFGGAFGKIDADEEERKQKPGIGFGRKEEEERELIKRMKVREAILRFGAEPELMGRISTIIQLRKLGEEDLKKILLHPKTGMIQRKQYEFERNGLKIVFTDEAVEQIAKACVREDLGARSAINIVNELTDRHIFKMFREGWKVLVVHEGMVTNDEPPKFQKGEERESRWKSSKAS